MIAPDIEPMLTQAATLIGTALLVCVAVLCIPWKDSK